MNKVIILLLILLLASQAPAVATPGVFAPSPPTIDGTVADKEWDNAASITLGHGSMLVKNDNSNIYILVDLTGDTTNDPPISQSPWGDYFWLVFDVNIDKTITPNVDIQYGQYPGTYNLGLSYFLRAGATTGLNTATSKMSVGFGASINSATPHRIWEFAISRKEIKAENQNLMRIGLRTYSQTPGFTDDKPTNFYNDFSNLIEITIASTPIPPNTPSQPSGQSSGTSGTSYTYSTSSTDSNNDQIKYTFDWGDGTQSTTGFVNSGSSASASHSWTNPGTYNVKAMATDFGGSTSGWSITTLTVTIESTPQLSVSPDPLNFNFGTMKAGETSSQIYLISNTGGGTLTWSVSDDQPWITINPTSGANSGSVTININTADMSSGSYSGKIIVTSNGGTRTGVLSLNIPTPVPTTVTQTTATTGSISISSNPSGASIYLDGVNSGETPKILNSISAGDHLVELKLKDYKDWSRIVRVEAGSSSTVAAPLTPGSSAELLTPPGSQTTSPTSIQTSVQTSAPTSTSLLTPGVISTKPPETPDTFQWYSIIFLVLILAILASFYIIRKSRKTEPDEYLAKVEEWKKEGYDVSELDRSLKGKK